ncbi:MAG: glycosyltransferase [Planctomycetes bacterium]|nr:glycosyltransferase [Planctomycetota bacterium]
MLTIIHDNPVRALGDLVEIDRKFLDGMATFVPAVGVPVTSTHPLRRGAAAIDVLQVPAASLPFRLVALDTEERGGYSAAGRAQLAELVAKSRLVTGSYIGGGFAAAQRHGVPYVMALEYDLGTQVTVTRLGVGDPLRRLARTVRCVADYVRRQIPQMRRAAAIHCNGFPIYDAARRWNAQCMLYLDSRMRRDMVIEATPLQERLRSLPGRRARVLYSGRYEAMKGALDFVQVAIHCVRDGVSADFLCHGQGAQGEAMRAAVAAAGVADRVQVRDAVPFPELVAIARTCDLFVACHVQSDPSCSYLEAMGAGLPVLGYGNRMWRRMAAESAAGNQVPVHDQAALAAAIAALLREPQRLIEWSNRARAYALQHCFEQEFSLRTAGIRAAYAAAPAR